MKAGVGQLVAMSVLLHARKTGDRPQGISLRGITLPTSVEAAAQTAPNEEQGSVCVACNPDCFWPLMNFTASSCSDLD